MRISGFDDPDSSGWDALHRGTEREGFDSPSKFDMSTLSMIMPKRKPARPQPDAQGYTDEDTREWGSSAEDEDYAGLAPAPEVADESYARPEPGGRRSRRARESADESFERPGSGGFPARRSRESADESFERPGSGGFLARRAPEPADESYARPDPAAFPTRRAPEPAEAAFPARRAPEPAADEHLRREPGGRRSRRAPEPDPLGYSAPHSPVVAEDGYDPVEPEWQDGETFEPEPPPLEPVWAPPTPPRGVRPPVPHPPAPRPPAPRPPISRPPAPPSRAQAAPPPAWAPPPPADWTPPPDPETRWVPHPEPWEDPGWHEPARVASPVPVASPGSRVRPYTRTGGRTRSDHNLALEALVSTSDDGRRYRGVRSVEHRRICDLCLDTRSVAEIAAHLRLPLGVVKVLVGDMADIGLVLIHQTELILGDRSSREFMERVLAGLRAL
ncbi:DUF742 domain-containing protein [Amycolatopsis tolypomycina]|uniref:DUF742 domain-containing protein n=1 Tax=Amycolatopsis tolypomycina TaxID=208445 RepID=UPI0033BF65D0